MNAKGSLFLEKAKQMVMIGDGAFGTMLYARGIPTDACLEALSLSQPEVIESILEEYRTCGAQLLETNSFCLNRHKLRRYDLHEKVIDLAVASARIARKVAGSELFVAGSIGPIARRKRELDEYSEKEIEGMFRETMSGLVQGGIDVIVLETFSRLSELEVGLHVALEFDVPVVCQMAFSEEGVTDAGITPEKAARRLTELGAHMIGANCQIGPKASENIVARLAQNTSLPISVFPNAGYAQQIDGRYVYGASAEYFGSQVPFLVKAGATLVGGCCGTGPDHIKAISEAVKPLTVARRKMIPAAARPIAKLSLSDKQRKFLNLFQADTFVTVEVEPPKDFNLKKTFDGARELAQAGCDAFNVPDNPLAVVRMDNMVFADLLRQNVDVPVILHLTCRDKNTIALKSDLLGAEVVGIEAILAVTGDPAAIGDQPGASSVYDVNSSGLVEMIQQLNQGEELTGRPDFHTSFAVGVALNPNGSGEKALDGALIKLQKKIKAGAQFAETQPVFDTALIVKIAQATKNLSIPVCLGLMPIVSQRNAEFLHNEVPGIRIPQKVRDRFSGLDKQAGELEAIRFSKELIDAALANGMNHFYIVPPFSNYALVAELVRYIKSSKK